MSEHLVKKANELINARYILPVAAQKLICYCASKIDDSETDFNEIEITAKELQLLTKVQNPYEELLYIADSIFEAEIHTNFHDLEFRERKRWVTKIKYFDGEGRVVFKFHEDIKPWLLQLKEKYTSYSLNVIENLFNKYSLRIYELIINNKVLVDDTYEAEFDLEYLKLILILDDKYSQFHDFKRYVLEPVIDELNKTNLRNVRLKTVKKGRSVIGVKFLFEIKEG
ncbi:MAG: replication initiation protein [Clostridia bacterium]|nr:replication initiation protein [Clostridia bacterium]